MSTVQAAIQASLGSLMFNHVDSAGCTWVLSDIQGWDSPGVTLQLTQKPRSHGSWGGASYLKDRTLTLTGSVDVTNKPALDVALDQLYAAVSLDPTPLTVHAPVGDRTLTVRRQDQVLVNRYEYAAEFSIQVVAEDPLKYGPDQYDSTGLASSIGGLTFPVSFPLSFPATVVLGQVSLTNDGNVTSPVRFRVDGPCDSPVITDQLGRSLSIGYYVAAGSWLDIDTGDRTIREAGTASRVLYLEAGSDWPQFEPGGNTYGFSATTFDSGSLMTVYANSSYL